MSDDELRHYGRKGMKWGVVNDDSGASAKSGGKKADPKGTKQSTKDDYIKAMKAEPKTKPDLSVLAANEAKFLAKFDAPPGEKPPKGKGLSPEQKSALKKVAIGGAVVGGMIALGYLSNKSAQQSMLIGSDSSPSFSSMMGKKKNPLADKAGQPVSLSDYKKGVDYSKMGTWLGGGNGYLNEKQFAQPEFTLKAGHTFNRISTHDNENKFSTGTYATHSKEDFNRYVAAFRGEKGGQDLHHVTFKAKEDIKVPDLTTTLNVLRDVLNKEKYNGMDSYNEEETMQLYKRQSGGPWKGTVPRLLFAELQSRGYGAIVDAMDAGVIGETPLVVFATDFLTPKQSTPLTSAAIKEAESSLIELVNRQP